MQLITSCKHIAVNEKFRNLGLPSISII